ncbi:MAG TPA: beta-galactosidase [Symbiobacteriaceae bacterium]|jgi:beta-galactosidase
MTSATSQFRDGIFYLDDQPQFFVSADYPYYRDDAAKWPARLSQLKGLGIRVITFYVPWRHHEVDGSLDFTGRTAPNRNVLGFLRLVQELGLLAVVKPGPFIHAELDFGGLPERMDPRQSPDLEPMRTAQHELSYWQSYPLPTPLGNRWQTEVSAWLRAVREQVIEPFRYPGGPIIALQVLNEGIYSDANRSLTAYDYAPPALDFFRRWQEERGRAPVPAPRSAPLPVRPADALPHLDWGMAQADYLSTVYRFAAAELAETGLPLLSNMHPAGEQPAGWDWWLAKVIPEDWGPVHYGFTNWIGVVSHDPTAFYRYLLLVKRAIGPNLEENWSFSDIYDPRYRHTVIPFYQTLLAMAAGATGFNVYTGVGTDGWDLQLDSISKRPYPDTAPIGADGTLHPKARTLALLTRYLERFGPEWLACRSRQDVAWAVYPPYAALAGWEVTPQAWRMAGIEPPVAGAGGLDGFMRTMRLENRDFALVNVAAADPDPAVHRVLIMVGSAFMAAAVQERLLRYVRTGGHLVVMRELPRLDGDLTTPCRVLADGAKELGRGAFTLLLDNPFAGGLTSPNTSFLDFLSAAGVAPAVRADGQTTQAWVRRHPSADVEHVTVLSLCEEAREHVIATGGREVAVTLPGRSAALIRLENGRIAAALVKGINDCDASQATPAVRTAEEHLEAPGPGDWLWLSGEGDEFIPWDWQ